MYPKVRSARAPQSVPRARCFNAANGGLFHLF
jgi:hypothetical protein